ncbi:MAG: HAMP domain-containing protein [Candidatus Latescibacteria bacterium]|nr:HAMP domain-containing protein [bacterium]MBD3424800.1 HAMP domain-containing protein [Candidatus Latescibacterota bacterium]
MIYYETPDKAIQLALTYQGERPVLIYGRIDPEFLEQAESLLAFRRTFATLRMAEDELSRSFLYPFIIIYALMLVISLVLAFIFSERLAAPIRKLEKAVSDFASGSDGVKIRMNPGGEIGKLVKSFNLMVKRINRQRRRIIDMEKMASWREIARHLAHEIKNPLLPIRLTVEEMKDQYGGKDERYREFLESSAETVRDELDSLNRLVREFSSFARMPGLTMGEWSLRELALDVVGMYPGIRAEVDPNGYSGKFRFDRDKIKRVLINLLDNSIAASEGEDDVAVKIRITADAEQARLEFSDSGPGIPEEIIGKIFEPYFTTRGAGTGLGLSVVKNIILMHGGDIKARNIEGGGARFTLILPLDPAGNRSTGEQRDSI